MNSPGFLDYVSGWFLKASDWLRHSSGKAAFVSTNSICQGQMVSLLWPIIFDDKCEIFFAHKSFKWVNLASHNAGVSVAIIGIAPSSSSSKHLYEQDDAGVSSVRVGTAISPYLTLGTTSVVPKQRTILSGLNEMEFGNKPSDGGHLLLDRDELNALNLSSRARKKFIRKIIGSDDFINARTRYCIWIQNEDLAEALYIPAIKDRIAKVRQVRLSSKDKGANALAIRSHQLKLMRIGTRHTIVVPAVSSERRNYMPIGLVGGETTLTNAAFGLYDAPLWNLSILSSSIHLAWIKTVCGQLETRLRYSNTMGWNTFPLPKLTEKNRADLTAAAEGILLAREAHFPATIADLYDPERMPENLRAAHDRNDEVLERVYIGRRFKNDTERLEKLFELYTKLNQIKGAA